MSKVLPHDITAMDENEFIKANGGIVGDILRKLDVSSIEKRTGLGYDDLAQVGFMALLRAKRMFKPELGWQFATYAYPTVRGQILKEARERNKIKIPRPALELYWRIVKEGLLDEDDEVISSKLQVGVKMVRRARLVHGVRDLSYLDEPVHNEDGSEKASYKDMIPTEESAADIAEANLTVQEFLATLKPRERKVWEAYRDTNCGNQTEVAKRAGVSQVQVSRILKAVHEKAEQFGRRLMASN